MTRFKKFFAANVDMLFCFLLLGFIFAICLNPLPYINATYRGFCVWAQIVLPSLFMFFILTKILMQMDSSFKIFGVLDKPFGKLCGVKKYGGYVFLMSVLSGYPIGAKLTSELYINGLVTSDEACRMLSFTSTSGPMFVVGSVASKMFGNVKLGVVIFVCHVLSALINGIFYKNVKNPTPSKKQTNIASPSKQTLNNIVLDSIITLLMVGGYIALCFCLLESILHSDFGVAINNWITRAFGVNIVAPIVAGMLEVTNGCVALGQLALSARTLCIILTCLTTFGGLSIHLQSQLFASKCGTKYSYFLKIKTTQTLIAFVLSLASSFIFF